MASIGNTTAAYRAPAESLADRYSRIRSTSLAICEPLEIEDYVVQSMPDASPVKWHLAHTSWFFEQFVLKPHARGYTPFDERFDYLFNSYYQALGPMHQRPRRGLLTRPTVNEVVSYRKHIDDHLQQLLASEDTADRVGELVTLGLNHEQQHQELMLTDLKHLLSSNPLLPAYRPTTANQVWQPVEPTRFVSFDGGIGEIGASGKHFCFDNEMPRHRTLVEGYALADRLVTNAEYLEFVRDGGYRRADFWLSDGWSTVTSEQWTRPLYWSESLDAEFTLAGLQPIDPAAAVCHLSYFEADAYARWIGARLPTEAEWELAAARSHIDGNLLRDVATSSLHPRPASGGEKLRQLFGDVWEWTASPYVAYPGYRPAPGALGEYNGKFMCSQLVLRGGSCVTPADHVRETYRNFFYPQARWQFMGLRLARDL
ncbi:ergothioneine biosynthesis protein EgtB [Povalibacter uvarum]|uniref:Ergothioneine biosynthesis protein EgtB n=1 Tax=Povalibacter uvarum TaxID=732238 RepID=A0A841HJL1_9GAMM|nr:ergothioneine biosynthesis protein EgtB [Povalibacter uvarum]MBB6092490.1 ergothioneine biosynthesis protein EgtB [Povalibacter uvarum]